MYIILWVVTIDYELALTASKAEIDVKIVLSMIDKQSYIFRFNFKDFLRGDIMEILEMILCTFPYVQLTKLSHSVSMVIQDWDEDSDKKKVLENQKGDGSLDETKSV